MDHLVEKKKAREFNLKDTLVAFSSFTFICAAVIFILTVYDVVAIQSFLSFDRPVKIIVNTVIASFGLLLFGIILTFCIPSKYMDDTNQTYQNYSLSSIFAFLFVGALFEELLFRGIIQHLLYIWLDNQWMAIIITTLLFLGIHVQYFKKPIMFINIAIPSLVFGWIYFETNNILAPFVVHFLMNLGMTLLFKYNLIRVKK